MRYSVQFLFTNLEMQLVNFLRVSLGLKLRDRKCCGSFHFKKLYWSFSRIRKINNVYILAKQLFFLSTLDLESQHSFRHQKVPGSRSDAAKFRLQISNNFVDISLLANCFPIAQFSSAKNVNALLLKAESPHHPVFELLDDPELVLRFICWAFFGIQIPFRG